jgi:hypothetical protein
VQVGPTTVTRERPRYSALPLPGGGYRLEASQPVTISQPVRVFTNITQRNAQEVKKKEQAAAQEQEERRRPRWGGLLGGLWG